MPFYEYICEACGKDFVLLQPMGAKAEGTTCPYCNEQKARKTLSKFSAKGSSAGCGPGGLSSGGG
jgi:putative FmdB family regulatory protein